MSYGCAVIRSRTMFVASACLLLASVAVAGQAHAASGAFQKKASTWDEAAAQLGTAGSLWDPMRTAGLTRTRAITVLADGLTFANGRAIAGSTFAGATYGKGTRNFSISQKWANTGWAAEPAFTTSMAKVGTVTIPIGLTGARSRVQAIVYANCFVQPLDADPTPIPAWFRCARSQVLTTGGVLVMTARPASTLTAPGNTSVVLQSTGLTYTQLISIASSLQQVAGSTADGAGSAQMVAMCDQMVSGRMTFDRANSFAMSNGYSARVGSVDGVPQAVTSDYRPDRFTLTMRSNAVTACSYG